MTTLLQVLRDLVLAFVAPRALLVAENLLLRQQVIVLSRQVKRPRLRHFDRWVLASIAGQVSRPSRHHPRRTTETVIRWHQSMWSLSRATVTSSAAMGGIVRRQRCRWRESRRRLRRS